jgi:hypothetical protein
MKKEVEKVENELKQTSDEELIEKRINLIRNKETRERHIA